MECSCVRHTDVPGTTKLYADLIHRFDRVSDFYPAPPNSLDFLIQASKLEFPVDRRAALVRALAPLNEGNPSLAELAKPDTVCIVTGQQVGLFSGPAYTVYKALTAIRDAQLLRENGVSAVPVFWLATEDHDFAEVDHAWVFGSDYRPVKIRVDAPEQNGGGPVGRIPLRDIPIAELRAALAGLPFAEEAIALVERAYQPGETMGTAFARILKDLFARYGMLLVDPLTPAIRDIAAPLLSESVERMPELVDALIGRSKELIDRGYHAQVLVDAQTSLVFLLENGRRIALRRGKNGNGDFAAPGLLKLSKLSPRDLAARGPALSPNALLRPVMQDYLLPTAASIGGPSELAYFAQSAVLYDKLLGRQPLTFPRAGFTLMDAHMRRQIQRYGLKTADLFTSEDALRAFIASRLVPESLRKGLERTRASFEHSLDALAADLGQFDVTLKSALGTSRRKIEYQVDKISRKTASEIMKRDERAGRDAAAINGFVFPEKHLQERLYSFVGLLAKFGPGLTDEIYSAVRIDCSDHQIAIA